MRSLAMSILARLAASLLGGSVLAAGCGSTSVAIVDKFGDTVGRIAKLVRKEGLNPVPFIYSGESLDEYIKNVVASAPKLVVVHYSFFVPGPYTAIDPDQALGQLIERVNEPDPTRTILYSSRLFTRNLEDLRVNEGLFVDVPDDEIQLLAVSSDIRRFDTGPGSSAVERESAQSLVTMIQIAKANGVCAP